LEQELLALPEHLSIYSICRCCWNVTTYEWKVHDGKIEIISFVVKLEKSKRS
jgi:hypothetical protein